MQKESLPFGTGSFVHALNDPAFEKSSVLDQALMVGYADGCPVALELTNPSNPNPQRGPEAMLGRYGEVNAWFSFIAREVQAVNPVLSEQLMTPVDRLTSEPVGEYEPESVPDSYITEMAPMGTLPGYALPRLLVKQIGEGGLADSQDRLCRGLEALDQAATGASSPAELLALFANGLLAKQDLSAEVILSGALSGGWLAEHNASTMLTEVKEAFAAKAPELWAIYVDLPAAAKVELKLA